MTTYVPGWADGRRPWVEWPRAAGTRRRAAGLSGLLDEAIAGRGRLVFLGGEAGVGKSTVVRALSPSAAAQARRGSCRSVRQHVRARRRWARSSTPLPRSADDTSRRTSSGSALFRRLRQRLAETADAAGPRGRALGRRGHARLPALPRPAASTTCRCCVVATYRDDEVGPDHPAGGCRSATSRPPRASSGCASTPLSVDARTPSWPRKPGPRWTPRAAPRAHRRQRLLRHRGAGCRRGRAACPATVRDAVLARTSRLSDDARRRARGCGGPGATRRPPAPDRRSGQAADRGRRVRRRRAAGRRRPRPGASGTTWPDSRRRRRCCPTSAPRCTRPPSTRWRAAGGADDHRLAFHAAGCGDARRRTAARRPGRGAVRTAGCPPRGRRAVPAGPALTTRARDAERSRLCAALSYECYLTDRLDEALEARRESMELAEDPRVIGDAERWLSRICLVPRPRRGRADVDAERAVRTLEAAGREPRARDGLQQPGPAAHARLRHPARSRGAPGRLELARRVGDRDTEIHALNNIGSALALAGRLPRRASPCWSRAATWPWPPTRTSTWPAPTPTSASTSMTTRHLDDGERYLARRHRLLRGARPRLLGALHARVVAAGGPSRATLDERAAPGRDAARRYRDLPPHRA